MHRVSNLSIGSRVTVLLNRNDKGKNHKDLEIGCVTGWSDPLNDLKISTQIGCPVNFTNKVTYVRLAPGCRNGVGASVVSACSQYRTS